MTALLVAAAAIAGTGAIAALAPGDVRLGLIGLTASLVGASLIADPPPAPAVLAIRLTALLLTENLAKIGKEGAEELTRLLETVYSALIAHIEEFGGSVISFAGDSMLCWFDAAQANEQEAGPSSAAFAVTCALALQKTMQMFADVSLPDQTTTALALKVAIATGPARRFHRTRRLLWPPALGRRLSEQGRRGPTPPRSTGRPC